MLTINPSELILTILNFFVLVFLLKRFLYKPLISFMDARRERIQKALEQEKEAFSVVRELERILAAKRKNRQDEAKRLIADARTADKLRYEEAIAKAKEQRKEERAAENDAALKRNGDERRQLKERQELLGELLAKSLSERFYEMPQIVFMDGRLAGLEERRKQRALLAKTLVLGNNKAIGSVEQKRNEDEQCLLKEQQGRLAALLAENLLGQFSNAPQVLHMDGRAVRVGQGNARFFEKQKHVVAVQQKSAAYEPYQTAQVQSLFAASGQMKHDAELQRNKEEQQLLEKQWEQLAALLAERLLRPGA